MFLYLRTKKTEALAYPRSAFQLLLRVELLHEVVEGLVLRVFSQGGDLCTPENAKIPK